MSLDLEAAAAAVRALRPGSKVLLVCHMNPDGDALGSMLGFGQGLKQLFAGPVQATFPGPLSVPEPLRMPGMELLVPQEQAFAEPDLLVTFDAASTGRLGELAGRLDTAPVSIVLDHHASNSGFGKLRLVDPGAAATAVVAAHLLEELGVIFDKGIAECLYIALVTDTGSFKFDLTTPEVHQLAARLVETGISVGEISRRIFDTRPFGAVKLFGEVLGRASLDPSAVRGLGLVTAVATLDDLERHAQPPYVLEALIDSVRCTAEADVACLLKQVTSDEWAVSLRSKGGADVSEVAVALGGGGHKLAAGFTGKGTAEDVISAVRMILG
ncbi:MAG TPA: bifunctional oligoribonuclease/PAP phosphatase NrnA [Candidatus Limnocylindrales bacterium]|nr:bifunctional oligoribonuclease/PAP phosphatase NrnA [Candidatus Limnocylindrales bacterium]